MSYAIFRSLESQLYNKANELQEDISGKRFDQKVAQIHLAAVRAQVRTFQNFFFSFSFFFQEYNYFVLDL